ncbi:MAG: type II secretion system protein GspM [Pseudomonadales bacterium]
MNVKIQSWISQFEKRNRRERTLLLSILVSSVCLLLYSVLVEPALHNKDNQQKASTAAREFIASKRGELTTLRQAMQARQQSKERLLLSSLELDLKGLDEKLAQAAVNLIPPEQVPEILERVIASDKRLKLVALQNQPAERLSASGDENELLEVDEDNVLYRHQFRMTLQGNYQATVDYLERLEQLPWRIYWDALRYEVTDYPLATVTLDMYTLSTHKEWIGV